MYTSLSSSYFSFFSFLLLTLLKPSPVSASSITITIPPSNILPNPHTLLPPSTHATLTTLPPPKSVSSSPKNEGTQNVQRETHILAAPMTRSSTFVFKDLRLPGADTSASYLLDIRSREFIFAPYRVDVAADGTVLGIWETFRGNPWDNRGPEKFVTQAGVSSDVVIEAKVVGRRGFYEERSKFSPLSLFMNPMILLAIVASVLLFGMPKLLENMDPEMRAEFEKQSRSGPLSNAGRSALAGGGPDLAGWMAGASSSLGVGADSASKGTTTGRETGGSGRRRG